MSRGVSYPLPVLPLFVALLSNLFLLVCALSQDGQALCCREHAPSLLITPHCHTESKFLAQLPGAESFSLLPSSSTEALLSLCLPLTCQCACAMAALWCTERSSLAPSFLPAVLMRSLLWRHLSLRLLAPPLPPDRSPTSPRPPSAYTLGYSTEGSWV